MKRHSLSTRVWHWLNFGCVAILFMSGLTISNAHPWLYWGEWGFSPAQAWLALPRFPGWMTIPTHYSLSEARSWHLLVAWPFALGLALMWLAMLANRHFKRDLAISRREWRWSSFRADIAAHLRLDFSHGVGKYNLLQKVSYALVLGILLPAMILTGLGISPGIETSVRPLIDLAGGRQSVRSLHFIFAWALFAFFAGHVTLVLLSGPWGQMRAMITGGRDAA